MKANSQRPIVCGTDFSHQARKAADVAAAIALRLDVPLLLIHGADELGELSPAYWKGTAEPFFREQLHKEVNRLQSSGAKVEEILAGGAPEDGVALRAERANARFTILGANGDGALTRWMVGSVSERIAESAWVPTLVLHETARIEDWARGGKPLRVFVGADFTLYSEAAMRFAGQLTEIGPCEFTIGFVDRHAQERAEKWKHMPPGTPFSAEMEEMLRTDLRQRASTFFPKDCLHVRVLPTTGQVESHLLDMAAEEGADLIVVGTHQWQGYSRLRRHSVSRRILRTTRTSVALVPALRAVNADSPCAARTRRVLVATDLSRHCGAAIPHAFSSLEPGGTAYLFHVTSDQTDAPAKRRELQELVPADALERDFTVEPEIGVDEDPVRAICEAAERLNVDLICVGSHAPCKRSASLGPTTLGVLTQSTRPVLVVPQRRDIDQ